MDIQSTVKNLHPLEVKVLVSYKPGDEFTVETVEKDLGLKSGNGNQALSYLASKGFISVLRRESAIFYEPTGLGKEWQDKGSPEERILSLIRQRISRMEDPPKLPEIAQALEMENKDIGSAFGNLSRLGVLSMDSEKKVTITMPLENLGDPAKNPMLRHFALLHSLFKKLVNAERGLLAEASLSDEEKIVISSIAKKRGAADSVFRQIEKETVVYGFTVAEDGSVPAEAAAALLKASGITGDETGALTQEMLATGSWKGKQFRSYNVQTPPVRLLVGRSNPYMTFLEGVKDTLISLGFEELDGPLVETEFWNSDALFMPQFHSARDIHDVYNVADPIQAKEIPEPWISQVSAAHENGWTTGSRGWEYSFDRDFTRRLILRSQGTVLSAKQLTSAKIPGKYFGIARCFRYDKVDATHIADFYQTDGIVLGEDVNLKTLLGMLEMFAMEVAGAKEVKYVPGYFPFTEPSIEVHIKHPVLGWFELGGSGIFRPEVTAPLGVNVPVAAWGIGVDRMALMALGINDLRDLFTYDLEAVRLRRAI